MFESLESNVRKFESHRVDESMSRCRVHNLHRQVEESVNLEDRGHSKNPPRTDVNSLQKM